MKLSSRWISVEDRSPAIGQEVLTLFHQGSVQLIFISRIDDNKDWYINTDLFKDPKPDVPLFARYWTPLR